MSSSGLKTQNFKIMTVDRQHTEIFDQSHQMWAEGTSIGACEGLEPKEQDIQNLLGSEGWVADEIDIWFDTLQKFWRWSCKIARP